jgi:3-hydroxyisobutyrate dehydrogenase-like beta-hydroxyacid dehydrogenase
MNFSDKSENRAYDRPVAQRPIGTVAVVGAGDMGAGVGRHLRQSGLRVITSLDGRRAQTAARARAAGIEDAGSPADAAASCDVFLSIVPPGQALALARAVGRDTAPLYVDCNAISPRSAVAVGEVVGEGYVDAGIIGSPEAPRFYACGPRAFELARLPLDLRLLDGPIGQASGLKMCYAALTKGLTALLTESMVAAEGGGLREALELELAESQPQLLASARKGIPAMLPKAYRWVTEMEEIAATFAVAGLTPRMHEGAADVYRFVESAAVPAPAGTLDEVVAELRRALAAATVSRST